MKHLAILGGGPAGYVAASHAAAHGARVTLIDAKPLGGTCLHQGCIPTKVLVESCALLEKFKRADAFGLKISGEISADWTSLKGRFNEIVSMLGDGIDQLMADRDVTCIRGYGRLLDQSTIGVNDQTISPDAILICTGSRPKAQLGFNVDGSVIGTSDDLLNWSDLPASILIIGSGIIACEFACILDSLGVDVTIVASGARLMSSADKDVSVVLQREMRKRGIKVIFNSRITSLSHGGSGVEAFCEENIIATAERALVAVGRQPNSQDIGLERADISVNTNGDIVVDDLYRTDVPHVYAVGDVNGRSGLAHAASAQAKQAVDHALGRHYTMVRERAIPVAVFTSPEIAYVGRSEDEAKQDGLEYVIGKFDLRALGRAHALGEISGFVKVVVAKDTGHLLGLHAVGPHATEIVHEGALVIQKYGKAEDMRATVHAHPTIAEAVLEAVEDALGQATHKPLSNKRQLNDVLQYS
ncbi:MAG: dihydrolipoyl dehydrogenase [Proteobacteria bacterium]|nr:dihydrolipoyl dehydrogenase [Pseudomonadota bacterium]